AASARQDQISLVIETDAQALHCVHESQRCGAMRSTDVVFPIDDGLGRELGFGGDLALGPSEPSSDGPELAWRDDVLLHGPHFHGYGFLPPQTVRDRDEHSFRLMPKASATFAGSSSPRRSSRLYSIRSMLR